MKKRLPLQKPFFLFLFCLLAFHWGLRGQDSLYHYWMQFPADIVTDCAMVADSSVAIGQNFGCGLLAIASTDERLDQPDGGGCYKILRKHRVINWCEYKGQAAPIVVSRDWDSWNGTNPGRCGQPQPNGNGKPGDEDFFVYVKRDLRDRLPDTVWYDSDNDPHNGLPDNPATDTLESHWWKVISGGNDPSEEAYYEGGCSTWAFDENQDDSDISGNQADDDNDLRYGSFGYWFYTQHITVYDQTPPIINWDLPDTIYVDTDVDCSVSFLEPIDVSDSCALEEPDVQILVDLHNDGENIFDMTFAWDGSVYGDRFGLGTHKIIVIADDYCGNTTQEEHLITVLDDVAPAPICRDKLVVEMMIDGDDSYVFSEVSALDLIASPIFDCTGQSDTLRDNNGNSVITDYSINFMGDPVDRNDLSLVLDCSHGDSVEVEIHAWDDAGNTDFCTTKIILQDNKSLCTNGRLLDLAGKVYTENNRALQNVEIQISGGLTFTTSTDAGGRYQVPVFSNFRTLHITPSANTNANTGISTGDMIRIQKHILGLEPFASPYQLLSADLDNNARINFIDLIRIRKMVLGLETGEDMPKTWYFIPVSYQFAQPEAPWDEAFPESLEVPSGVNPSTIQTDFIAVKIGDANYSLFGDVENRSGRRVHLHAKDQMLAAGQTVEIDIQIREEHLEALQFALQVDPSLEVLAADPTGSLSATIQQPTGQATTIKTVWMNDNDQQEGQVLRLHLRAKNATSIRQAIRMDHRSLTGEAYEQDQIHEVDLQFEANTNQPGLLIGANPFFSQTSLSFDQPVDGELNLYDQQGRMVWSTLLEQTSNTIIQKKDLGQPGIYFFTVRTNEKTWTGKLVCQ